MLNVSGYVGEHGSSADVVNRAGGGEESERSSQHLIAAADIQRPQRQQNRVGAVGDTDCVRRVRQLCDLALETVHGLAKDE